MDVSLMYDVHNCSKGRHHLQRGKAPGSVDRRSSAPVIEDDRNKNPGRKCLQ